jgi:polyisoprenyl-teichoic acid--peptidoglycan teichoic acid transferase
MRTTLKRGVGRGATANGNGSAVFPPGPISSVTRYRQPPPPARTGVGLLGRILLFTFLALTSLGLAVAGGAYLYFHQSVAAVQASTPEVVKAQKVLSIPKANEPAIALVIGYDHRAGFASTNPSLSDTLMLIRADPQSKTISLLSFPRDLDVPIYCNTTSSLVVDRINSAWSRCGPQGTLDTVQKLTGIPVNYLITLDFHGFKLIVNKLHGVYMNVDHRYINTQGGSCASCYATIDLHPGYQKLDGQEALDFVRSRHTDNDIYRNARQQLFLEALKDRLATGFSLFAIPQLIGALKHNLEIARGGSTGTPSMSEIQSYVGGG